MQTQGCGWETRTQASDEIAIDFDCLEMVHMFEQRRSKRAGSRPDFDNTVGGLRGNGGDDLPDDAGILQKILAEPLSWDVYCLQRVQPTERKEFFARP